MAADTSGDIVLCEPAQSKCRRTLHKSDFVFNLQENTATDTSGDIVWREPAQSKCTWTKYNSHLVCKFRGITTGDTSRLRGHRFVRACAVEMHMDRHVTRGILRGNLQGKCRTCIPRRPFCATLRSRNAHGHVTRSILRCNLQGKCRTRIPRRPFCATLRKRNAHGHVAFCAVIYKENAGPVSRHARLVRPCANEMHMDMSHFAL